MKHTVNEENLVSLVKEVDRLPPAFPTGYMKRQIDRYGFYEELGLKFTVDDVLVGLHYSGLAVLARDMGLYLDNHQRDDAALFKKVVDDVNKEESQLYSTGAFPIYEGRNVDSLPEGLASAAVSGRFDITPLENIESIVHEWTLKAGKRFFTKLASKFKETVCGKDGPYEQFNNGLLNQATLPTTIASTILITSFSTATFWYPLAVYMSILLVKTGLKTYCESK
jgi:hypothetical protein